MLDRLTIADFASHVGQPARLTTADGTSIDLELADASLTAGRPARPDVRHPFSLIFFAPSGAYVPQQICRVEGTPPGTLEIFVVPIGPDPARGGMRYEAIFG